MIAELKAQAKKDRDFMEKEYKEKIKKLEEDLKIARSGFEAERQALEKKRTDMQADYEKSIAEMK
jgi:polyhydroxyalkanoate synthesis regulator phasin